MAQLAIQRPILDLAARVPQGRAERRRCVAQGRSDSARRRAGAGEELFEERRPVRGCRIPRRTQSD